jgi:hypothetical protein
MSCDRAANIECGHKVCSPYSALARAILSDGIFSEGDDFRCEQQHAAVELNAFSAGIRKGSPLGTWGQYERSNKS